MRTIDFIKSLRSYDSKNVFNPYSDKCEIYDRYDAERIRARNLSNVLNSFESGGVDSIWIGRDLGHRGGRRTGLALTDEAHLEAAERRWNTSLSQATKGSPFSERTALNIWSVLNLIEEDIFMWNVFPFHPHEKNNPLTNRSHTAKERDQGIEILSDLIKLLKPKKLVAIGNDAHKCALRIFSSDNTYKVRHPSYGGEKEFIKQMCRLYNLNPSKAKDFVCSQRSWL